MDTNEPQVLVEKRRNARIRVDFAVRLTPLRTGQELLGISADVSETGMAVYLPQELWLGEHVRLSFHVSDRPEQVTVEAVVRNKNGYRYGFEYVQDPLRKKHLDELFQITTAL